MTLLIISSRTGLLAAMKDDQCRFWGKYLCIIIILLRNIDHAGTFFFSDLADKAESPVAGTEAENDGGADTEQTQDNKSYPGYLPSCVKLPSGRPHTTLIVTQLGLQLECSGLMIEMFLQLLCFDWDGDTKQTIWQHANVIYPISLIDCLPCQLRTSVMCKIDFIDIDNSLDQILNIRMTENLIK